LFFEGLFLVGAAAAIQTDKSININPILITGNVQNFDEEIFFIL
jgi:hypothetical protein